MKKQTILYVLSILLYSYLFYLQSPGINFFVFSVFTCITLVLLYPHCWKSSSWLTAAFGTLVSGAAIAYYGSTLTFIGNILSLTLLSALSNSPSYSVVTGLFSGFLSYLHGVLYGVYTYFTSENNRSDDNAKNVTKKILMYIIPVCVSLIFFMLYRSISPVFDQLTAKISFNFISFDWFVFTLSGVWILYGLLFHRSITSFISREKNPSDILINAGDSHGKTWTLAQECTVGVISLGLINGLLFIINVLDVLYLYTGIELPENVSYSQMVHGNIQTLILSIILSISLLLFLFRGQLNDFAENKWLKRLAYLWLIQNTLLVIAGIFKNSLYVDVYSLTYKRIGVYVYLLLAIIGLFSTFIKITHRKTTWHLFRINSWAHYAILIVSTCINWDVLITRFNITRNDVDIYYLISLSNANLPELTEYAQKHNSLDPQVHEKIKEKQYDFERQFSNKEWPSWCIQEMLIQNKLARQGNHQALATTK